MTIQRQERENKIAEMKDRHYKMMEDRAKERAEWLAEQEKRNEAELLFEETIRTLLDEVDTIIATYFQDVEKIAATYLQWQVRNRQLRTRGHRTYGQGIQTIMDMNDTAGTFTTKFRISLLKQYKYGILHRLGLRAKQNAVEEWRRTVLSPIVKLLVGRAIQQLTSANTIRRWYLQITNQQPRNKPTIWETTNITPTDGLRTPTSKHTTQLTPFSVHHSHTTWGPPPIDTISTIKHNNTPTDDDGTSTTREVIAATTLQLHYRAYHIEKQRTLHKAALQIQHWLKYYSHRNTMEQPSLDLEQHPVGDTIQQFKEYNHTLVGGNTNNTLYQHMLLYGQSIHPLMLPRHQAR